MSAFKKYLGQIIALVFLAFLIIYFINNQESFKQLLEVPIWVLAIVAAGKLTNIVLNAIFTSETLKVFKKDISLKESFLVSFMSAIGNFFGPLLGGTSLRGYYLKNKLNFAYKNFISTLMGYYVILFFVGGIVGLASLIAIGRESGQESIALTVFFSAMTLSLLFAIIMTPKLNYRPKNKKIARPFRLVDEVLHGWKSIKNFKGMPTLLAELSITTYLTFFVATAAEFWAVGADPNIANIGLYAALFSLSMLVALTPGALGIREAVLFAFSAIIGLSGEQILQIAVIDRSMNYLVLASGYLATVIGANKKVPLLVEMRAVLSGQNKSKFDR